MKRRTTIGIKRMHLATLPAAAMALVLSFQNCGPGALKETEKSSYVQDSSGQGLVPANETKTVGVTYSEAALTAMAAVTGVQPSARTLSSFNDKRTKIAETGKADSVNAPMWVAMTNLAGEQCLDLVNDEKAKATDARRFFKGVDFSKGPAMVTADMRSDIIRRMARSFWARNETKDEKDALLAALDEAFASAPAQGAQTDNSLIFLCTAMLSSLSAHER